jgi:hypothetical protein
VCDSGIGNYGFENSLEKVIGLGVLKGSLLCLADGSALRRDDNYVIGIPGADGAAGRLGSQELLIEALDPVGSLKEQQQKIQMLSVWARAERTC